VHRPRQERPAPGHRQAVPQLALQPGRPEGDHHNVAGPGHEHRWTIPAAHTSDVRAQRLGAQGHGEVHRRAAGLAREVEQDHRRLIR